MRFALFHFVLLALGAALLPCRTLGADAVLPKVEAAFRSKLVSEPHYALKLRLDPTEGPTGSASIRFRLAAHDLSIGALRLDVPNVAGLSDVRINGVSVPEGSLKTWGQGEILRIPLKQLVMGPNQVDLKFEAKVSDDGSGLSRIRDGRETYFYTDFQPFYAHRVFPSFDQPDLKATFQLTVDVPEGWVVASATRESKIETADPSRAIWTFPTSTAIPPYAFSVFAGPFAVIQSKKSPVPMRILVRASERSKVPAESIFSWTEKSLSWMGNYLNRSYPYGKYDHVFIPDYHSAGMENVGSTTLNESLLIDLGGSSEARRDLMATVFHEVAHAWFGNLVTYEWWNGLWIHEGLANYFASLLMSEVAGDQEVDQYFYSYFRLPAETADIGYQRRALDTVVPNTAIAEKNFDRVTYAKSASVFARLFSNMGFQRARQALQTYVRRFSEKAATPAQFLEALEAGSGFELGAWWRLNAKSAGVNSLKVHLECEATGTFPKIDHVIKSLALEQSTSPQQGPIRSHIVRVGLMNLANNGKRLETDRSFLVHLRGPKSKVSGAEGLKCPVAVDPNLDDAAYVREILDERSRKSLLQNVSRVSNAFHRQRIWKMLWDQVRLGLLSSVEFLRSVSLSLLQEPNYHVLLFLLENSFSPDLSEDTAIRLVPLQVRQDLWLGLEQATLVSLRQPALSRSSRNLLTEALIDMGRSREVLSALRSALASGGAFKGVWMSSEMKWRALTTLARSGDLGLEGVVNGLLASSEADDFKLQHGVYSGAPPSRPLKQRIWRTTMMDEYRASVPDGILGVWNAFHWIDQESLVSGFGEAFFRALPEWSRRDSPDTLFEKVVRLYPSDCREELVQKHAALVKEGWKTAPRVMRVLAQKLQQAKVCVSQRNQKLVLPEPPSSGGTPN